MCVSGTNLEMKHPRLGQFKSIIPLFTKVYADLPANKRRGASVVEILTSDAQPHGVRCAVYALGKQWCRLLGAESAV